MTDVIESTDLLGQAELIARGEVTALELAAEAIGRIEALNPAINAIIAPLYEEARQAARNPQLAHTPFRGAPFLIKDLYCHMVGLPTTGAARVNANFVPDHDSELMARYRRAGLVTLAKTNLCEFGTLGTTEPVLFGPTRNPWNLAHSSGGSSGGAGAAVASGMVPAAHGGDGAGSIRIPASCCGVFGLKPTRGRITLGPDLGESLAGIVNEHVLSVSVRDSAALLDATHGPMPGDPYFAPPPAGTYLAETQVNPGRLRIAVTRRSLVGTDVHGDCLDAIDDAVRLCAELGHEIIELDPEFDAETYDRKYRRFWAMTATRSIWGIAERLGRDRDAVAAETEAFNQYLYSVGSSILAADYVQDLVWFHAFSRGIARFMAPFDAWLTPTLGTPPPRLGHFDGAVHGGAKVMDRFMEFLAFTTFANMAGLPSMSVPLHWSATRLPVGSMFTAKYGDEAVLFRLAAQLEQARPWAHRRPPAIPSDPTR